MKESVTQTMIDHVEDLSRIKKNLDELRGYQLDLEEIIQCIDQLESKNHIALESLSDDFQVHSKSLDVREQL